MTVCRGISVPLGTGWVDVASSLEIELRFRCLLSWWRFDVVFNLRSAWSLPCRLLHVAVGFERWWKYRWRYFQRWILVKVFLTYSDDPVQGVVSSLNERTSGDSIWYWFISTQTMHFIRMNILHTVMNWHSHKQWI